MEKPTVMLLDNYIKMSQLYSVSLETYVGCNVTVLSDIKEAEDYFKNYGPSVVMVRSVINERDIASKFYKMIQDSQSKSELIVLGKSSLSFHHAAILENDSEVRFIIRKVAEILGVTAKEMADRNVGDFYSFSLETLFPKLELTCDIHTVSSNNMQYQMFLPKGSVISKEIINILENQGCEEIFVKAEDRLKFVNTLMMHISDFLADDKLDVKDSILLGNKAYKMIRESARKMEITPEVIMMTETNINTMISIVNQIPKLSQLMAITTESSDEHFKHSLMINYVVNHILSNMEWGTQEQKMKLTFVSFFHNITLPSELIYFNNEKELLDANISQEAKDRVMKHALQAAKIVSKFKTRIPFGVDTIIKQHHGSRDGTSFTKYPQSISPLAIVFMIADEWVTTKLKAEKAGTDLSKEKLNNSIKYKYKGQVYDTITATLDDLS